MNWERVNIVETLETERKSAKHEAARIKPSWSRPIYSFGWWVGLRRGWWENERESPFDVALRLNSIVPRPTVHQNKRRAPCGGGGHPRRQSLSLVPRVHAEWIRRNPHDRLLEEVGSSGDDEPETPSRWELRLVEEGCCRRGVHNTSLLLFEERWLRQMGRKLCSLSEESATACRIFKALRLALTDNFGELKRPLASNPCYPTRCT